MALYGNHIPNESGSIELDSQQYEIGSLQSKGEDEELYCVIDDCDLVESNISKAGTSPLQQGNSKTDSNKLGENVFASSSHPTEEQANIIGRTTNHTLKDSNQRKSNTKATILLLVGIVAVGVASSAITVIIKGIKSSKQDCKETEKHTDSSSLNPCNGSALPLSAGDTLDIIVSPGYPFSLANNLECSWLIDSGIDGQSVAIYLEHYDINCSYGDSLSVYNGSSSSDFTLVDSVCGRNNTKQVYVSSDRYVLVTFTADSVKQGQGFQLTYVNVPDTSLYKCPVSQQLISASGTPGKLASIKSPGYHLVTANYISCTWLIDSGVDGQAILLDAEMCKTEFSYGQVLTIYDGSTASNNSTMKYYDCVRKPNCTSGRCDDWSRLQYGIFESSDRYVLVNFETLSANQGEGFQLSYVSVPDTSATGCTSTYTLTASTTIQYLTSESFPSRYSDNSHCSWLISSLDSSSTISIAIVWSELETTSSCTYDYLTFYNGSSTNDPLLMTKYCDSRTDPVTTPTTYTSTSNNVLVVFVSDGSATRRGFIIKYSVTTANIKTTTLSTNTSMPTDISTLPNTQLPSQTNTESAEAEMNIPMIAVISAAVAGFVIIVLVVIQLVKYFK